VTRITGDWLTDDATQQVLCLLEDGGYKAFVVGGCVRNALLGVPVRDVDISTDARPPQVIALAEAAGLKVVPTGIDHGTVTVVADKTGFEVTTFRADVETDGRRAVVCFSNDVLEDAERRDFTMNALYADRRGSVLDPLGGLPDLEARRFRFILDAQTRIREDYLRILRFFRFNAWYGDPAQGMEAETLAAIAQCQDGLDLLSRERVGSELVKLLCAPDPLMAVSVMERIGVLARVLPGATAHALGPYLLHEGQLSLPVDPMGRMAALGFEDGESLRLSKTQQRHLTLYRELSASLERPAVTAYRHGGQTALIVAALRSASLGTALPADLAQQIAAGRQARFPLKAADLMPAYQGAELGDALRRAETLWIDSGFALDKAALMGRFSKG
jgi:poly(A) polymerase